MPFKVIYYLELWRFFCLAERNHLCDVGRVYFFFLLSDIYINGSKTEGKDQKSIQSRSTHDPGYQGESDNVTIRHHKREPRGHILFC